MTRMLPLMGCLAFSAAAAGASADETLNGFLCCNMHSDGKVISDLNVDDPEQHLIAVGTPIKTTAFHKHKVKVVVENSNESLLNEYSQDLPIQDFARRYIVQEDPRNRIKTFPKNIQYAISVGHWVKGMSREQVLMSVGYPVSSEVPKWRTECSAERS